MRRFQSYLKHCHYMMRKYLYDTLLMEFTQSTYKIRGCTTSGIHIWNNSTCWLSFFNLKYGTISTIHHYTAEKLKFFSVPEPSMSLLIYSSGLSSKTSSSSSEFGKKDNLVCCVTTREFCGESEHNINTTYESEPLV